MGLAASFLAHPIPLSELPRADGPLRFAVGDTDRLTSNSWRAWVAGSDDIYVACRDNFKEVKVSLHASGRWRMGMTEQAERNSPLLVRGENRAWEVWNAPSPNRKGVIRAFQLQFLTSELAVKPDQRSPKLWGSSLYLAPAPEGKILCVTLFLAPHSIALQHESEPSLVLGQYRLQSGRDLIVVAHHDPVKGYHEKLRIARARIALQLRESGVAAPAEGYLYLYGKADDGARFVMPAFAPTADPQDSVAS